MRGAPAGGEDDGVGGDDLAVGDDEGVVGEGDDGLAEDVDEGAVVDEFQERFFRVVQEGEAAGGPEEARVGWG